MKQWLSACVTPRYVVIAMQSVLMVVLLINLDSRAHSHSHVLPWAGMFFCVIALACAGFGSSQHLQKQLRRLDKR